MDPLTIVWLERLHQQELLAQVANGEVAELHLPSWLRSVVRSLRNRTVQTVQWLRTWRTPARGDQAAARAPCCA